MARDYRIELRTTVPLDLDGPDEFHAMAGRLARAVGVKANKVTVIPGEGDGREIVARIWAKYTEDGVLTIEGPADAGQEGTS